MDKWKGRKRSKGTTSQEGNKKHTKELATTKKRNQKHQKTQNIKNPQVEVAAAEKMEFALNNSTLPAYSTNWKLTTPRNAILSSYLR